MQNTPDVIELTPFSHHYESCAGTPTPLSKAVRTGPRNSMMNQIKASGNPPAAMTREANNLRECSEIVLASRIMLEPAVALDAQIRL